MFKRKILSFLLIFVMLLYIPNLSNGKNAEAVSKREKALKAYQIELMSDGMNLKKNKPQFAIIDLNRDNIPELVVTSDGGYHFGIVVYAEGKSESIYNSSGDKMKFYPNKHMFFAHTMNHGVDSYVYAKFDGKKMKWVAKKVGSMDYNAVTGKVKTKVNKYNEPMI